MVTDILRGGLVGCGDVAKESHMGAWQAEKGAAIVAVCDRREEAAADVARWWGGPRVYGDFDQMLASESLDFVDICTPPLTHLDLAARAMELGLHVLVEKPMAATAGDAERMAFIASERGAKLCVAHNFLTAPAMVRARSMVADGAIGDLIGVDTAMRPSRERLNSEGHWHHDLPGGALHEYAPHVVYTAAAFLGKVRPVGAVASKLSDFPWVAADELRVVVESERGVGTLSVCCNQQRYSFTAGSIFVNSLLGRKWYKLGHRAVVHGFVESVRSGGLPPVTPEDGLETVSTIDAIWRQLGWSAGSERVG
jgi:predicted dehydrogenase